jgi:hypothetical protein
MSSSAYRVPRSPADQLYDKGPPPPPTRMGSGDVLSVEAESVTVQMHGTTISGVAVQGDMPGVGDQIDVWSQDDLLYTPGDGSSSSAATEDLHIVSTRRPGTGSATDLNIAGSFRDDSWFFEETDLPEWDSAAREDGTGLEVTLDGTVDQVGILWSDGPCDVRPGDELVFTVAATYLAGTIATMQTMYCWGEEDTDPLPSPTTAVLSYSPAVDVDGVGEEMESTVTVPSTVTTADASVIVPLRARVGIRFTANVVNPYAATVMSLGPPLWYFRYENVTTNLDSSGNNLTWNNGYANSTDVPGLYPSATPGRARSYPGTNGSQLNLGGGHPGDQSFTFACGASLIGGTGDWNVIFGVVGTIAGAHSVMLGYNTAGQPMLAPYGSIDESHLLGPTSLAGAGTRHLVYTYSKTSLQMKIYVDGVQVAFRTSPGPIRPGHGFHQMAMGNGARYFKGTVDEAAFFEKTFTDAEVTTLYRAWAAGK